MVNTAGTRRTGAALLSDAASPAQLRVDLWNRLRDAVERAARGQPPSDPPGERDLLRRLDAVERLWAYPGPERMRRLRDLHACGDQQQLTALVRECADRLSAEGDRAALEGELPSGQGQPGYFTVLLVDTISPEDLRAIKLNLLKLRSQGKGDLVYELVQVGSFEEAWLAVLCNTDIQPVAMRQSF